MELKNVLKVCDDALSLKDYEIKCLREENLNLKTELKHFAEQVEELRFKYEGYKEGQK